MRIRILMAGNSEAYMAADAEMLKENGFLVYTCNEDTIDRMVDEVHPDVVFVNPKDPTDLHSMNAYQHFLDQVAYASYPVMYTLSDDDVYIVNRKRTASKHKRTVITDNIIDGIKTALLSNLKSKRIPVSNAVPFPSYASRA